MTAPSKPKPKVKRGGGRPSAYRPEFVEQATKLCRLGAMDKELADFFGVHVDTIHEWKKVHPEFSDALKTGKAQADAEVADKLFRRATGYEHPEDDIRTVGAEIVITPTTKRYPPDTTAAIFWLKNRRPDLWRDKVEQALTGADGGPVKAKIAIEFVKADPQDSDEG